MRRALEIQLHRRLLLLEQLTDTFLVHETAGQKDLLQQPQKLWQLLLQDLRLDLELRLAGIRLGILRIRHHIIADAARIQILEIGQLGIGMIRCIDTADQLSEQECIRQLFLRYRLCIKEQRQIHDAIRLDITEQYPGRIQLTHIKWQIIGLTANIRQLQHRNRLQRFLRLRTLLPFLQCLRRRNHRLDLRRAHCCFLLSQQLFLLSLTLRCHRLAWCQRQQRPVRIVQEQSADQILEISRIESGLHLFQYRLIAQICLRLAIIQPGLHDPDTIDQSLRCRAEIRLAQTELQQVDGCLHQRAVQPLICELPKRIHHQCIESLRPVCLGIIDHNAEIRLQQVILKI